jgi:hypothetical protein
VPQRKVVQPFPSDGRSSNFNDLIPIHTILRFNSSHTSHPVPASEKLLSPTIGGLVRFSGRSPES